ncbi:hypothetical protein KIH74_10170 [Kineosporia sp. J2-2]|uniref:Transmembrane protein n=1 Tax=Kineosporia corallincola TaxID=2835133 RepID=A0ABS5TDX7_9ACTN|nr:hypothetical protein [Kineosporia corallincola]MBT0769287.1 hypothetical protein [Kineosporia corallincola]
MTNHPTPQQAVRMLRENEERQRALQGAAYPAWVWFLMCGLMVVCGVVQDIWGDDTWVSWIFLLPWLITLAAQNRWIGSHLGFRVAPGNQGGWGPASPRKNALRVLGILVVLAVIVGVLVVQNTLDVAASGTIAWTGGAVVIGSLWPAVRRLFNSEVSLG